MADLTAEAALVAATRTGDVRAAEQLLAGQRAWLARFVARHVRRREDAEDLVQDVLARATASLDRFRGDCPFSQWVLVIARRAVCNYYERDPYHRGRLVPWPEDDADTLPEAQRNEVPPGPSSMVEGEVLAGRILEHMARVCSADERRVITMAYQGEALEEIAAVLGKSASTVRSLYRRGRQKLLSHLVLHDPDLLGGREAMERAWQCAVRAADAADRPTEPEARAWREPDGRLEPFRAACLKMARFLPLGAVLLWLVTTRGQVGGP